MEVNSIFSPFLYFYDVVPVGFVRRDVQVCYLKFRFWVMNCFFGVDLEVD